MEAQFLIDSWEAAYYSATHAIQHVEAPLLPEHGIVRKFGLHYLKEHGILLTKQAAGCLN